MKSRYIKTERHQLPKHKRSEKLYGSYEDSNKYIKCWNCGFILDITRIITGDGNGVQPIDATPSCSVPIQSPAISGGLGNTTVSYVSPVFSESGGLLTINEISADYVLLQEDGGGDPLPTITPRLPQAVQGCSFCGCKNLP
jgi:hypothetical protein